MAESDTNRLPDLRNATVAYLVDETKRVRAEMALLKRLDAYYSTALRARMGSETTATSENWIATVNEVSQERISPDLCRELLDAETLGKVTVLTEFTTLSFTPRPKSEPEPEPERG